MNIEGRPLEKMAKALVHHYLRGGTIEQAVRLAEQAGLPQDLLAFPGMMFSATSAACAVSLGAKTMAETLETLKHEGAPEDDARVLLTLALNYIRTLAAAGDENQPIPPMNAPWFEFPGNARSGYL
jgi:hypothetical protein